jgi:hypothetical protein
VGLTVTGDRVEVVHPRTALSLSAGQLDNGRAPTPHAAVALPDGRVAALHRGRLVLAVPFGGVAVRQART